MCKLIIPFHSEYFDVEKNQYHIGGVETYIRNLSKVAIETGLEPHVFFPYHQNDHIEMDGVHLHSICPKRDNNENIKEVVEAASNFGDPLHDLFLFADSTMICKTKYKRTIAIQHGVYWDREDFHGQKIRSRFLSTLLRSLQAQKILRAHSLVSQIVCVDLNYVNWMRALSMDNRLNYKYVPNFAEVSKLDNQSWDNKIVKIVFARRFEEIRGCRLIMNVMPSVLDKYQNIEFTLAGGGSLEQELKRCFGNYQNVIFTKYDASQSLEFHSQFNIALVPSIASEGTSLSLLEAMSSGCAVIATDIGGMSNIIMDRYNGLIIPPTSEALKEGLTTYLDDMPFAKSIAEEGRKTVQRSFSKTRWRAQWKKILLEMQTSK